MNKGRSTKYALAAAVSSLTFVMYLPTLRHEFVNWDDSLYIYENPYIRSFDISFFRWAFFDFYAANWHPLTWISHALDYALWGLNPMGHHLTNNILHAVNTFLVVLLVARLIETVSSKQYAVGSKQPSSGRVVKRSSGTTQPLNNSTTQQHNFSPFTIHDSRFVLIAAAVTGLLFGLHPLHVESVAWVAERKDLLCALFYLLSIMAYTKYLQGAESKEQRVGDNVQEAKAIKQGSVSSMRYALCSMRFRSLLFALCFFVLALLSKPMAVSLPIVLLILDWYPFGRIRSLRSSWSAAAEKIPFIALSLASSVLTIVAQKTAGATELISSAPLSQRLIVAAKSLIDYLSKMVMPVNLIPFYSYPKNASLLSSEYFLPIFLVLVFTVICLFVARRQKLWLSFWGYYVVTLIPVLGIIQVGYQSMADRYTYLPSIGPFLLAGLSAARVSEALDASKKRFPKLKPLGAVAAVIVIISISYVTVKQIGIWNSSISLWTHIIEKEPSSPAFVFDNRGSAFNDKGQFDRAIEDFNRAIAINPSSSLPYRNRGSAFINTGRFDSAIGDFSKSIAIEPSATAYYLRGIALEKKGRADEAVADYEQAIVLDPSYASAYFSLGVLYGNTGSISKAINYFDKAIEIMPSHAPAYGNRGLAYSLIGQFDKALQDLGRAIELNKTNADAYIKRGNVYLKIGRKEHALLDFRTACSLGSNEGCVALRPLLH